MIRVLALIAVTGAVLVGGQSRPATQPERSASERRLPGGVQGTPPIQVTLDGLSRAALAQIDGSLELRGLQAPVTVTRDRWGVPHIVAQSTGDL